VPREIRHTFVSLISSNGTVFENIADLVGHKGTATTETVYRKVIVPNRDAAPKSWTGYLADGRPRLMWPRAEGLHGRDRMAWDSSRRQPGPVRGLSA
jgi:hypothetical protein